MDLNPLAAWIVVTFIFMAVIGILYKRVARAKERESDEDSNKEDQAPAY